MEDAKLYLRQIGKESYTKPIRLLDHATLGEHTRHFIEYFQCLFEQYPTGIINYDKRSRDKSLEIDPYLAIAAIDDIINRIDGSVEDIPLEIESDYGIDGSAVLREKSYFRRELIFNIEHTIHHLSIIKIGLGIESTGIQLPSHFGLTPSTVKYRQQQQLQLSD